MDAYFLLIFISHIALVLSNLILSRRVKSLEQFRELVLQAFPKDSDD